MKCPIESLWQRCREVEIWVEIHLPAHFQKFLLDKLLSEIDQSCKVRRYMMSFIFSLIFFWIRINLNGLKLN